VGEDKGGGKREGCGSGDGLVAVKKMKMIWIWEWFHYWDPKVREYRGRW